MARSFHFLESSLWFGNDFLTKWFKVWETEKSLLGLSAENRVDGVQRMSDVLPDNGSASERQTIAARILH
jgi:hypothetical protein